MLREKFSLVLLFIILLTGVAYAQEVVRDVEILRDATGHLYGLRPQANQPSKSKATTAAVKGAPLNREAAKQVASDFLVSNKDILGLTDPAKELAQVQVKADSAGLHQRYRQSYKGLPVFGSDVIVHTSVDGQVTEASTKVARNLPNSIVPSISKRTARSIAIRAAKAETGNKFKLESKDAVLQIFAVDLVTNKGEADSRLAYLVVVNDSKTKGEALFSQNYWVDAKSGAVLLAVSNHEQLDRRVYDCAVTPSNASCYIDTPSPNYYPYMNGRSETAGTRGASPVSNIAGPVPYNNDYSYFLGSRDVDNLHSLLGQMHSYIQTSFGMNGGNRQGGIGNPPTLPVTTTRGMANYDHTGSTLCPNNASFSSPSGSLLMCKGMVVNDIVGHEYAHAMAWWAIPGGTVSIGEAGALNESHSDIQGEAFEYSTTGVLDWKDARFSSLGTSRDLANPPSLSYSTGTASYPFPDRNYSAGKYCGTTYDNGGAHANSTIPSKAFYLIAQGGEFNGCDIAPQGIEIAKQLYWKAFDIYFTQSETFNQAYSHIISACNSMYSASVCGEVSNALQAVELDQAGSCTATPEAAPACAVQHIGTPNMTYKNSGVTTTYAPGEEIWVSSSGGVPGKTVNYYLQPHVASMANWSTIPGTPAGSATVGDYATSRFMIGTAPAVGQYDVILDENGDGKYQPWADHIMTINVQAPVNNDGACYRGGSYAFSENCHDQPNDCACPSTYSCTNIRANPQDPPFYSCYKACSGPYC